MRIAEAGIAELLKAVDTLLVIPNQNLFRVASEKTTFADAFALADQVLYSGVACISDLIVKEGLINLDFADVLTVMREKGKAMMGRGEATGAKRVLNAAVAAISNPLIEDPSLKRASGLIISITGGKDLMLFEVDEAATRIREEVDEDANIIVGTTFDERLEGIVRVSVVATGIDNLGATRQTQPAHSLTELAGRLRNDSRCSGDAPAFFKMTEQALQRLGEGLRARREQPALTSETLNGSGKPESDGDPGRNSPLTSASTLVFGAKPIPALGGVRLRRLHRINNQTILVFAINIHARPAREIVCRLRATVQHDDQRKPLTFIAAGYVELIGPTSGRICIACLDECPACRHDVSCGKLPRPRPCFQSACCIVFKGISWILQPL